MNVTTPGGLGHRVGPSLLLLAAIALAIPVTASAAAIAPDAVPALPVTIATSDPHLRYCGRFDHRDPAGPRCGWSACMVAIRFRGAALDATMSNNGGDYIEDVIDGVPSAAFHLANGMHRYRVADHLAPGKVHTVVLCKRTEAFCGVVQFCGFGLGAHATLVPMPHLKHRIEIIGDSITAGYGNEGANQNVHFKPETENAWLSYGPVAARLLHAECRVEAWSGIWLMEPPKGPSMPDRWMTTLPMDPSSHWVAGAWQPDAVVINLGTNDAGRPIDRAIWDRSYKAFIATIRTAYPKADIFCTIGPMSHGPKDCLPGYLSDMAAAYARAGDHRVHAVPMFIQDGKLGFGSDWHPSVATDALMAKTLATAISATLGWKTP